MRETKKGGLRGVSADESRSLEQLEDNVWGEPTYDSGLVTSVHRLRKLPLHSLTTGDLRLMLGQGVGLPHLTPLALAALEQDPFDEGDRYPGALLRALVHGAPADFWRAQPAFALRLRNILQKALEELPSQQEAMAFSPELRPELEATWREALQQLPAPVRP